MKALTAVALTVAALLSACAQLPPMPAAAVSNIKTIAVVVGTTEKIAVTNRDFLDVETNDTTYTPQEWGVVDMAVAALRRSLEPRCELIIVPAEPVSGDDLYWSVTGHRVERIVAPAMAASGAKADAILFFSPYSAKAFPSIPWNVEGCGIHTLTWAFTDKTDTWAYCVASLLVIDPATMRELSEGRMKAPDPIHAAALEIPDFKFQSVQLTPEQVGKAKAGIAAALDHYIPIALRETGLIP